MQPADRSGGPAKGGAPTSAWPGNPQIEARENRNLILLALHQIVFRVGWIFKTESVIIPAFLDWVVGPGGGVLRGMLPVLNRAGQSLPPVFLAGWLRSRAKKKFALAGFTAAMGLALAVLALACFQFNPRQWAPMPWVFLGVYGLFFLGNGMYHLSFGTTQGKLIRPRRRGRLLLVSTFYGSLPAMLFAWWLLPSWLLHPDPGFAYIFAFALVCFLLAAGVALWLFEPSSDTAALSSGIDVVGSVSEMLTSLRADGNLRRTTLVAMLFASGLIVLPHYQALALGPVRLPMAILMVFAVTQNASVGIFSLFVGPMADRWGNRLTLGLLIAGSAVPPAMAVVLALLPRDVAAGAFWAVFIPLGITPLVLRILINYTLEICSVEQHPRYLSTVNLWVAVPFVLSPLVGWLIDFAGFIPVFSATATVMVVGSLMTFTLDEPRHRLAKEQQALIIDGDT